MATTGYAVLKKHFDKLFVGGYSGTGFEPIRTTYEAAFNRKINLFDVYQTDLKCSHNPLSSIITLIGPEDTDGTLPTGHIMCNGSVVNVSAFSDDILKGFDDKSDLDGYLDMVFHTMFNVTKMDRFYDGTDEAARYNPYIAFIRFCPLYFTFHHYKDIFGGKFSIVPEVFTELLEKYFIANEDTPKVIGSLIESKYSEDPDIIYRTVTCANTIELFW